MVEIGAVTLKTIFWSQFIFAFSQSFLFGYRCAFLTSASLNSLHIRMLCAKSSWNRHNDILQELCTFTILHWYCLLLEKDEYNDPLPKDALYQILSSTYGEWNKSHAHTIQAYNNNSINSSNNNNKINNNNNNNK